MTGTKEMAATRNNIPRGSWDGAPAIPASDTPVVNNTGLDQMVRVNGGTVSAMKIDGVATGIVATGEWVPLRNGSSLTLTYTVVPTSMVWFPWH
jgi:hypothetical protein